MKSKLLFLVFVFALSSCLKEEKPVPAYPRGDSKTNTVNLGNDYDLQVWFSLENNQVVSTNHKNDWDFAISSTDFSDKIWINYSRMMSATKAKGSFANPDTLGATWRHESNTGSLDSLALVDISIPNSVWIIHLGNDIFGNSLGHFEMQMIKIEKDYLSLRLSIPGISKDSIITINRNKNAERTYFSLKKAAAVIIEPSISTYDLIFTQYSLVFKQPVIPYIVTGVLTNNNKMQVALDTLIGYTNLQITDTATLNLKSNWDGIGYEWKEFFFSNGKFEIKKTYTYLIKTSKGFYYKLRFTDFYNVQGQKGSPSFEFQKL